MSSIKTRLFNFYEANETKVDICFFLGGVVFDILTLSAIDDPFSIIQQVAYLLIIGFLLYLDFLAGQGHFNIHERFKKAWVYRDLAIHFLLGSLLSVYSLFYIKSASVFASFVFIMLMVALMILNEVKAVQRNEINLKIALYLICVFSFFSMMFPVILGFVGYVPFLLSLLATSGFLWCGHKLLCRHVSDRALLRPTLVWPGSAVVGLFFIFYVLGWIPPVPLSVQSIGVYHQVQRVEGRYQLTQEKSGWNLEIFGEKYRLNFYTDETHFLAEPGDVLYVFVRIFSPARFSDMVNLHWQYDEPRKGWKTTDRIPMKISGGRAGGYRGYAAKANYVAGDWRILVETTDGREIGRLKFRVTRAEAVNPGRVFETKTE